MSQLQNVQSPLPFTIIRSIDKLPSEILGEIFKYLVRSKQELLITTGVCNRWRDVAHTTPQLWTDVLFSITPDTPSDKVNWAKNWLKRSGGLPIAISLSFDTGGDSALESSLARVAFGLIESIGEKKNITRCHTINLVGPPSILSKFYGNGEGASNLDTLELNSWTPEGATAITTSFNFGPQAAPANLFLSDVRLRSLEIKWSKLEIFHANDFFFDELLDLFRLAPMLKECVADDLEPARNSTHLVNNEVVTHSKLSYLEVNFKGVSWDTDDLEYFFQMINMCNLTGLDCEFNENEIPGDAVAGFIRRSQCSLLYLRIGSNSCEDPGQWGDSIINITTTTPKLLHLCLNEMPHFDLESEPFLRSLCMDSTFREIPPNEEPILPLLQELDLTMCVAFPWKLLPGLFGTSSESHPAFKRPFQRVDIKFQPHILEDEEEFTESLHITSTQPNLNPDDFGELHALLPIKPVLLKDWATYGMVKGLQDSLQSNVLKVRFTVGIDNSEYKDLLNASRRYLEITSHDMA